MKCLSPTIPFNHSPFDPHERMDARLRHSKYEFPVNDTRLTKSLEDSRLVSGAYENVTRHGLRLTR